MPAQTTHKIPVDQETIVLTSRKFKPKRSHWQLAAAMLHVLYGPALWVNSFIHKHEDEPS